MWITKLVKKGLIEHCLWKVKKRNAFVRGSKSEENFSLFYTLVFANTACTCANNQSDLKVIKLEIENCRTNSKSDEFIFYFFSRAWHLPKKKFLEKVENFLANLFEAGSYVNLVLILNKFYVFKLSNLLLRL